MAARVSDGSSMYSRADGPSTTNFTATGWSRIISSRGSTTAQVMLDASNAAGTSYIGIQWENSAGGTQAAIFTNGGSASFGSRPGTGVDFFWAVTCSGTGTNSMQGRLWWPGQTAFVTAQRAGVSFTVAEWGLGNYVGGAEWADARQAAHKTWNGVTLSDAQLWAEVFYYMPVYRANLWSVWPLLKHNDLFDYSGNGRTLTSHGTPTTEEGPPILWEWRRTRAYSFLSAGAQTLEVGLVSETDSIFSVSHLKTKAVGLLSETDSVLALTKVKAKAVGQISETDSVLAPTRNKAKTVGLLEESDSVLPLQGSQSVAVGLIEETDSVLAITRVKSKAVGLAEEADSVLAVGKQKAKAVGLVSESDSVLTPTRAKGRAVGLLTETDSIFSVAKLKAKTVGLLTEIDSIFGVTSTGGGGGPVTALVRRWFNFWFRF